jgi:hypothetical protein
MPKNSNLPAVLLWVLSVAAASVAYADPPVPLYSSHVSTTEPYSAGAVILTTSDSVDAVCAWYRANLKDMTGEKTTPDGAHIFYTKSAATVDVEPGNRFDPGTKISLSWDAKKYGAFR